MTRVKLSIHHACVSLSCEFNSAPCTQKTHTAGKTVALVYSSHVVTHQFKCCGADGKEDWSKSVGWENHEAVPDSCCVVKSDGCGQNKESAYSKVCGEISFSSLQPWQGYFLQYVMSVCLPSGLPLGYQTLPAEEPGVGRRCLHCPGSHRGEPFKIKWNVCLWHLLYVLERTKNVYLSACCSVFFFNWFKNSYALSNSNNEKMFMQAKVTQTSEK